MAVHDESAERARNIGSQFLQEYHRRFVSGDVSRYYGPESLCSFGRRDDETIPTYHGPEIQAALTEFSRRKLKFNISPKWEAQPSFQGSVLLQVGGQMSIDGSAQEFMQWFVLAPMKHANTHQVYYIVHNDILRYWQVAPAVAPVAPVVVQAPHVPVAHPVAPAHVAPQPVQHHQPAQDLSPARAHTAPEPVVKEVHHKVEHHEKPPVQAVAAASPVKAASPKKPEPEPELSEEEVQDEPVVKKPAAHTAPAKPATQAPAAPAKPLSYRDRAKAAADAKAPTGSVQRVAGGLDEARAKQVEESRKRKEEENGPRAAARAPTARPPRQEKERPERPPRPEVFSAIVKKLRPNTTDAKLISLLASRGINTASITNVRNMTTNTEKPSSIAFLDFKSADDRAAALAAAAGKSDIIIEEADNNRPRAGGRPARAADAGQE